MINFFKKYKYILLITLISLAVYFRIINFSIFTSADWTFQFSDTLKEMLEFNVWTSYGIGKVNVILWRLFGPNSILFGLFGYFGFDSNIADKFLIFWPWVFISGISSFLLVKKITKSNIGGFIGFLVFSFNTYFLSINTQGHLLLSTAAIFVNFSLLFFIKSLEDKKIYLSILTGIFLFISGANDLRMTYIAIWIMFFYSLYFIFIIETKLFSDYKKLLRTIFFITLPIIIFILLNIFWILPSFLVGSLYENDVLSRSLFGNQFLNITNSITLFHPFWIDGKIDWFIIQKIPFYFWLIPIFAFFGLILNRKNKNIVFFGFISLLGIFLAKQAGYPFEGFYKWMFLHFPGFNAFREATKFFYIIILGYSILIGALASNIYENLNKTVFQKRLKWSLLFLISIIFLYNTKPIITGEIGNLFVKKEIGNDYLILKDYILKQDGFFRTFWTPIGSRWGAYTNQKQSISNGDVLGAEFENIFNKQNTEGWPVQNKIVDVYNKSFSNNLFDSASIKYIIIPLQDIKNSDDFFIYYGGKKNPDIKNWYIGELDKIPWIRKIYIGTKDLVVYTNLNYKDHIYTTKEQETIYKNVMPSKIDWACINPTKYNIYIKNLKGISYINFSEFYHPDWSLKIGKFSWFNVLFDNNYFLDNSFHLKNDSNLNSFKISSDYIKASYPKDSYIQNPDGSIDIELTIYFKSQSYFYLGIIISSTTFILLIGYLGYAFLRRKKNNLLL